MEEKIFAKKSLGQHFLKSEKVLDDIIKAAEIKKEDTVFEIGPGTGNLTQKLLDSPAKVIIACEKDDQLFEYLKEKFSLKAGRPGLDPGSIHFGSRVKHGISAKLPNRLKLIHQDALLLIPGLQAGSPPRARFAIESGRVGSSSRVEAGPLKVVANLPYNIASPAIISLLSVCPTLPERLVVMLQYEVAQRLVAKPGDSNRGLLTVFLELFGRVKIVEKVVRSQFSPPPQVESAVVLISGIQKLEFKPKDALKILKLAFAGKRKKIKNSLFSSLRIPADEAVKIAKKCGFSLDQRPEELTVNQWKPLIEYLVSCM